MLNTDIDAIVPMLCVTLAGLATMIAEAFRGARRADADRLARHSSGWPARRRPRPPVEPQRSGFGVIAADNFGLFVTLVLVVVGILTIMFSSQVVTSRRHPGGRILLAGALRARRHDHDGDGHRSAGHLHRARDSVARRCTCSPASAATTPRAPKRAFKYFLLGAFSSAFFLYGIALTYGITGSTRLADVGSYLSAQSMTGNPMILIALGLLLVGFAFKISAVPFHMWTPDAYEGAPAIVTGFMSTGVKAAAFAAFARVFLSSFEPFSARLGAARRWVIAALTMILGTVVGVAQSSLKRMLAYSSIAHGGYLLVGLVAANQVGKAAILFYLLSYAVTNLAAFGVIALLGTRDRGNDEIARLCRPVAHAPASGGADDRVAAVARRAAADGGLHRQVVHLQRRCQRRLLRAGDHRRADERRLRLLLPARGGR